MRADTTTTLYSKRWTIAATVLIGTWIGTLSNSLVPVALPSILEEYNIGLTLGVWVVSIYVLLFAVPIPIFGWLGDRYGNRPIYLGGMAGLALSSIACALAPSIGWLIVFRAAQGLSNAMIISSLMAILSAVFPGQQRGAAMGAWAAVNGAAHGLGPAISGFIVQHFNWQATFWATSAVTVVGWFIAYGVVPRDNKNDRRPFDLLGAGALTLAMLTFMFTLTQGSSLGWGSWITNSLWLIFVALLVVFILTEARVAHPFVELRLFANKRYSAITGVISGQFFVLFGLQLLLPLYLIQTRGLAAGAVGLIVAPLASTLAIVSPLAGRAADQMGYQRTMIFGMALVTLTGVSLAFWRSDTPLWLILVTLVVMGLGMGFSQSPAATGITLVVRQEELGVAVGIFNMIRFLSGTLGSTVFGLIVGSARAGGASPLAGFYMSFYLVIAVAAAAVLLSAVMPRPPSPVSAATD